MYLAIILMPLVGSIISGFLGRKIGVNGSHLVTCGSVILTTALAILGFIETGLNGNPVLFYLFKWVDSESLDVFWGFNFDSLTLSMLIPVLIVSSLVHLYSIGYMSHDPHNQRFFSYLSLFTFMMIILVTANNYLLMFVGWEGVGICSYLLVSFWFTRIAANQSSIAAILTNRVGDCFLTIGMFGIVWSLGNLDYTTVFSLAPFISENIITIIGICLLLGAMAKSSQIGLHIWLPMAMEGPTPVSALIHAATMVTAGVYLLIRSSPLLEYSATVLLLCLWIGAITSVFSSLIGLFQQDIKKVIAYSTMSQLGLMVVAVGLSSYALALFHLVNHAFYKALLFLGAGAVIHGVEDNQDFRKYGGLKQFLPLSYSVMLIASLSLVAFPFMTGFYSKDFILESSYGHYSWSSITVYYIATIGAMFTTLYSIKTLYLTFITNPNGPSVNYKNVHEGNIYMSLPLIILAVFSIFFGLITKDMFIGLGSNLFSDNSIFIHPTKEIMINTEFAVPTFFKLLPLGLTVSLIAIYVIISVYLYRSLMKFKFSRIGYNTFSFFNLRFLIELLYNKYITEMALKLGGQTTKVLDKGAIEYIGPYGLEIGLGLTSKSLSYLDKGIVTTYAIYILGGGLSYLMISYLYIFNNNILIILLLLSVATVISIYRVVYNISTDTVVVESSILKKLTIFKKLTINRIIAIIIGGTITTLVFGTLGFIFAGYFGINIDYSRVYENIWYFLTGGISICVIRSTLIDIIHHCLDSYFNPGKLTITLDSPDSPDSDEIKKSHVIAMNNPSSSGNPSSSSNNPYPTNGDSPTSSSASSSSDNLSSTSEDDRTFNEAYADLNNTDFTKGWNNGTHWDNNNSAETNEELLLKSRCIPDPATQDVNASPFERFVESAKTRDYIDPSRDELKSAVNAYMTRIDESGMPDAEKQQVRMNVMRAATQGGEAAVDLIIANEFKNTTQDAISGSQEHSDRVVRRDYVDAKRSLGETGENVED